MEHPRFGLIRGLKALENIEQVTKKFLALINFMLNIIKQCHKLGIRLFMIMFMFMFLEYSYNSNTDLLFSIFATK